MGRAHLGPVHGRLGPRIRSLRWTSPRPLGVGATREIVLRQFIAVREHFFRWDEGSRYSFHGECNRPVRRFAEDYLVEKTPGGCRFTWTIAFEPADDRRAAAVPAR